QQVGWVKHPDLASPSKYTGCNIQSGNGIGRPIEYPIAIGVFKEGNLVCPARAIGWSSRQLVKLHAQIIVHANNLDTVWIGILVILYHPQTAPMVKAQFNWLSYFRFRQH